MQRKTDIARDDNGRPVSGASVSVFTASSGYTTLANLYSPSSASDTPTTTINNPIVTGSDGVYSFAVDDGDYSMTISGSNITTQYYPWMNFFDSTTAGIPGTAVSSVGLSMPAEFSVSGSPLTSPGTITVSKATETANYVWAGPTTGAVAAPTFRALVAADVNAVAVDLTTAQASIAGAKTFTSALTASAGITTTTIAASSTVSGTAATFTTGTFSSTIGAATVTRFTAYNNASPTAGDVWLNSTTKGLSYYNTTTQHNITSSIICDATAVTLASSTTETTLLASAYTVQANHPTANSVYEFEFVGIIGNTGTPTLTLKAKIGGATVCTTGAVTMSTITGSMMFVIRGRIYIRTAGGTGTAIGLIEGSYQTANGTAPLVIASPTATATTIDTTANSSLDVTAQWSANSASNTMTITGRTFKRVS